MKPAWPAKKTTRPAHRVQHIVPWASVILAALSTLGGGKSRTMMKLALLVALPLLLVTCFSWGPPKRRVIQAFSATSLFSTRLNVVKEPYDSYDVIVVGSGIGGLSCASMLSLYGYSVAVFERVCV